MEATAGHNRRQPNFKRRLQDFLEGILAKDPTFEDHETNSMLHLSIIRQDLGKFEKALGDDDFVRTQLNRRNADGKSPIFLTIEHGRTDMFNRLFLAYAPLIDWRSKDSIHGNTPLHMACL